MKRAKTAVIGLGNLLLADEGAGMHAVQLLEEKLRATGKEKEVDIVHAGTPGMNLLHQFAEREKIIFIDAGKCGLLPGEFIRFRPQDVESRKDMKGFSLHEFDLLEFLAFASSMGLQGDVEIVIYCIQPGEVTMSQHVSTAVKEKLPGLVQSVYDEVIK